MDCAIVTYESQNFSSREPVKKCIVECQVLPNELIVQLLVLFVKINFSSCTFVKSALEEEVLIIKLILVVRFFLCVNTYLFFRILEMKFPSVGEKWKVLEELGMVLMISIRIRENIFWGNKTRCTPWLGRRLLGVS